MQASTASRPVSVRAVRVTPAKALRAAAPRAPLRIAKRTTLRTVMMAEPVSARHLHLTMPVAIDG